MYKLFHACIEFYYTKNFKSIKIIINRLICKQKIDKYDVVYNIIVYIININQIIFYVNNDSMFSYKGRFSSRTANELTLPRRIPL